MIRNSYFLLFSLFFICTFAWGEEDDSERLQVTGQQFDSISLNSVMSHTEYRWESVRATCSRRVLVGYRRVCRNVPTRVCRRRPNGTRVCRNIMRRQCRDIPQYRTEFYICFRRERVSYQVFDYETAARVEINYGALPDGEAINAGLTVNLDASGNLSFSMKGARHLIVRGKLSERRRREGTRRYLDALLEISYARALDVLSPVRAGINEISVDNNQLRFNIGAVLDSSAFALGIDIFRSKIVKDKKVFGRDLRPNEYKIDASGRVSIDLGNLLRLKQGKKYRFVIKPRSIVNDLPGRILNRVELAPFQLTRKFKTRI